jgi:hypothetical protein
MQKLIFPDVTLEEIQQSGRVAKVVELVNLRMVGGQFGPSGKAKGKRKKGSDPFGFQFSTRFTEGSNTLEVSIAITAEDVHSAAEARVGESGMDLGAGFILTYQLMTAPPPVELRESLFTAFSRINGLINAWPYFREFAHQAATRMGYPEVVVPLLRIEPNQAKPATEKEVAASVPKAVAKKPTKK